jgi:hypothetical protein
LSTGFAVNASGCGAQPVGLRRNSTKIAIAAPKATASGGALKNAISMIAALAAAPTVSAALRWRVTL